MHLAAPFKTILLSFCSNIFLPTSLPHWRIFHQFFFSRPITAIFYLKDFSFCFLVAFLYDLLHMCLENHSISTISTIDHLNWNCKYPSIIFSFSEEFPRNSVVRLLSLRRYRLFIEYFLTKQKRHVRNWQEFETNIVLYYFDTDSSQYSM